MIPRSNHLIILTCAGSMASVSRALATLPVPDSTRITILPSHFYQPPIHKPEPPSSMIGLLRTYLSDTYGWPCFPCHTREASTKWRDFTGYLSRFRGPEPRFLPPRKFRSAAATARRWNTRPRDQRERSRFFGLLRIAACFIGLLLIAPATLATA